MSLQVANDEYDLVINLSETWFNNSRILDYLHELNVSLSLNSENKNVLVIPPEGVLLETRRFPGVRFARAHPGRELREAIASAAASRRALAVISDTLCPTSESLLALMQFVNSDPMIASVQPRFALADNGVILPLPGHHHNGHKNKLHWVALSHLPRTTVTPELPSVFFVMTRRAVLAALALPTDIFTVHTRCVEDLLVRLRRLGYRNLVCNHITVSLPKHMTEAYTAPKPSDKAADRNSDRTQGNDCMARMPELGLEALLSGAFTAEGHLRLLLDCRGVAPMHNGTSLSALGYLKGFSELTESGLEIVLLFSAESALFHDVHKKFSSFEVQLDRPTGYFYAVVLLNQPWSITTLVEYHSIAPVIIFNILDTISWDIIYTAPPGLDTTWRMISQFADGLLFISNFSLDRFRFRFAPDDRIPRVVTYLSLKPQELVPEVILREFSAQTYLLVIGNSYDHKGVDNAVNTIVAAFPSTEVVAIGTSSSSIHVKALSSGSLDEAGIHGLMANAAAIVFPSHYEGFGLPVAEALSHGRPVIVRDLSLWREIGALSNRADLVSSFQDDAQLVDAIRNALHSNATKLATNGHVRGASVIGWRECAQKIVDLVNELALAFNGERWIVRNSIIQTITLARAPETPRSGSGEV